MRLKFRQLTECELREAVPHPTIEEVRRFVRFQNYNPMTEDEIEEMQGRLQENAKTQAEEGIPFTQHDWDFFEMLIEERAPWEIRFLSYKFWAYKISLLPTANKPRIEE